MKRKIVVLNTAKELFEKVSLDYQNLYVEYEDNIEFEQYFELSPEDYLKFAKQDLKSKDNRGHINALSNAKRAIDCLVENVLKNFEINPKKINKVALDFCEEVLGEEAKEINPQSLRLFTALGLSPSLLVTETRNLRNKVEHEFSDPNLSDVKRSFEVAELLINNLKAKELYSCSIDLSDIHKNGNTQYGEITGIRFASRVWAATKTNGRFELSFYGIKENVYIYVLNQEDKIFYYYLRAMFMARFDLDDFDLCIKKIIKELNPDLNIDSLKIKF
ncbi:hypothetical protein BS636_08345 [Acinetobacter sp. LoGeW2-3]|nr:hypothetical protein BS636_08345 [Acinetobacter sp. LoGeW2-3]